MNRPSYFLVSRTEHPRPSQALYEANLALLEANSANLGADFVYVAPFLILMRVSDCQQP